VSDNGAFALGDPAPFLELPDTGGEIHGLPEAGEAPATIVFWTSNHCPYALAWHDRLMAVARDAATQGVRVLAVNSNDPERYPADSPDAMRTRVEAGEFDCPYLHDADQAAARGFGAKTTPDVFLLDEELFLRYRGAPDADHENPSEDAAWLRDALDCVLRGARVENPETEPVGCSIKWRDGA
jgi:peroxiredoxin